MKYTTTSSDLFQHLQMNAGIIVEDFDPSDGTFDNVLGATTGGVTFNATPEFTDFGEDIDNIPVNMMELKKKTSETVAASGTFVSVTSDLAAKLAVAADVVPSGGYLKIVPRKDILKSDFKTIWLIGDYSDVNTGANAGYLAIKIMNALSTGGFQMQTTDGGKGNFAFELTGHYTLENPDVVPYEIYIKQGTSPVTPTAKLSSLEIGELTLSPTFDADTTAYTASTTNSTDTITAAAAETGATISITNGETTITNGGAATWVEGNNTVTVTVTNGTVTKTYTVTVTKS